MRIARIGMLGALLFGATACQTDDGGPTTPNIPPLAFVRYINAVPDTFNTTVRFLQQVEYVPQTIVNVPYRGMNQGGYQGLEAGSHRFRAFTFDPALNTPGVGGAGATSEQLADTTFTFVAGNYYTILHAGFARAGQLPAQKMYIIDDQIPAVNATGVLVRLINAGVNLPAGVVAVDGFFTADSTTALAGAPAFPNIGYAASTTYATRTTGAFAAQFTRATTLTRLAGMTAFGGTAGTPTADPIAGATVGGSVLTAVLFGPITPGSRASTTAPNGVAQPAPPAAQVYTSGPGTGNTVIWFQDRQPARTTP